MRGGGGGERKKKFFPFSSAAATFTLEPSPLPFRWWCGRRGRRRRRRRRTALVKKGGPAPLLPPLQPTTISRTTTGAALSTTRKHDTEKSIKKLSWSQWQWGGVPFLPPPPSSLLFLKKSPLAEYSPTSSCDDGLVKSFDFDKKDLKAVQSFGQVLPSSGGKKKLSATLICVSLFQQPSAAATNFLSVTWGWIYLILHVGGGERGGGGFAGRLICML